MVSSSGAAAAKDPDGRALSVVALREGIPGMKRYPRVLLIAVSFCLLTGPSAMAETLLERGAYLMQSVVACGNCHTPQTPSGPAEGMELAGRFLIEEAAFTAYAPNITQDRETGIGGWSDQQIITAIREGRRPDGTIIGPPMPIGLYRRISDRDVSAILAYLRTVEPVRNIVKKSEYRMPLPPAYGPPVATVPDVPSTDPVAYGAYLAGPLGHCIECHSPPGPRGPDMANNLGAGGYAFNGPWGVSHSANITPIGLADWSVGDIKKAIAKGVRPDGRRLMPPMGFYYYKNITDSDLNAIVAYLRTLAPK